MPQQPKIKHKERNKQRRFRNSAECHGLDGRKDPKMFGSGWRTFKLCYIQKLAQVSKPQDFSFRLVYEECVISNTFSKHYLFSVRPNLIYTLYMLQEVSWIL